MDQEQQMTLDDWLDDLSVRFIINLPQEDLSSTARICFQVEEAHWFYEDFIRVFDPSLPHMNLKDFCMRMFQHCPILADYDTALHVQAYQQFVQYKTRIPVRGAIMLNHDMDSAVLVRGWKANASWSFPRGKINKDEDDLDCAVREVYEETGFDIRQAGLVPANKDAKYIEVTMRDQHVKLYVFRDVPMDTVFEPKTRNEIGAIEWYSIQDLPAYRGKKAGKQAGSVLNASKFYMVAPFLVPLKKWVVEQKKQEARRTATHSGHIPPIVFQDDAYVDASNAESGPEPHLAPENQGHALLSMLRSGDHAAGQAQPNHHIQPHTPMEHILAQPQEPRSPHYHHTAQRIPHDPFGNPPQMHLSPLSQSAYQSQPYQTHPYQTRPHVQMDANGFPNMRISPEQQRVQPQLVHPQPQPPQVNEAQLIRDMFNSPHWQDQRAQPAPALAPRNQNYTQANPLAMPRSPQGSNTHAQPSAHSQNLLNMFKNSPVQPKAQETNHLQALAPTDKHRSGLLDMFKQADVAKPAADQNVPPARTQPFTSTQASNSFSTADILQAAAQENGRPLVMNPELNLPFGALSIASRPKPNQDPPGQPISRPIGHLAGQSANQTIPQQTQRPDQLLGYPYGADLNRGVSASDMAISRAPDASALPRPNMLKPRREATTEQRTQLLSLFGTGKGKDPVEARPRSRVASIASGAGGESAGSRRGSRGSQGNNPLSPADQSFLMTFLKTKSENVSR